MLGPNQNLTQLLIIIRQIGHEDIRDRFRRTSIGIAWIPLTFTIFFIVKLAVFGFIASKPIDFFGPYLLIGFALWTFIASSIIDGSRCYISYRPWILSINLPHFVYILCVLYKNILMFLLILPIVIIVTIFFGADITIYAFASLLALPFYLASSFGMILFLAPIATLNRDLPHMLEAITRVGIFATPIMWYPTTELQSLIAAINPAFHYLEVVRQPVLNSTIPIQSICVCFLVSALLLLLGIASYTSLYGQTARRL